MTFSDNGVPLATVPVANGQASLTTNSLALGSHAITATYSGDANCAPGTSGVLTQVVSVSGRAPGPVASATVSLISSQNPSTPGQPVTLTATVTCPGFIPTGSVAFADGGRTLGSVPLTAGQASFTTSALSPGSHALTAAYSGDGNCTAAAPGTLSQIVTSTPAAPSPR